MTGTLYTKDVLRLAASLHEPHPLDREDGRAEVRSPTCGSRISLVVQLDDERRVEQLSMRVHACAFGQASAALLERHSRGRSRNELSQVLESLSGWLTGDGEVPDWPEIGALEPARARSGRHGAILLPFRALVAAIEDAG